jgi:hypothetical protein
MHGGLLSFGLEYWNLMLDGELSNFLLGELLTWLGRQFDAEDCPQSFPQRQILRGLTGGQRGDSLCWPLVDDAAA